MPSDDPMFYVLFFPFVSSPKVVPWDRDCPLLAKKKKIYIHQLKIWQISLIFLIIMHKQSLSFISNGMMLKQLIF